MITNDPNLISEEEVSNVIRFPDKPDKKDSWIYWKESDILQKLRSRGAANCCSRCDHEDHTLIEGYFSHNMNYTEDKKFHSDSKDEKCSLKKFSVPTILVVCNNCGYLNQHSIGILEDPLKRNEIN